MASRSVTLRALVLVTLFGLAWAHALGLTHLADPTAIDWMISGGDWMAHFFGWLFVRAAPWGLPLGQAPGLLAPYGTNAALTDAIPLLSTLGKLVSPFAPDRFQLFGLWLVSGVIGTGVAGVLAVRAWLKDVWSLTFAGCLFVMNPIVSTRPGHPSFMAFWVLTGLVGAALWPVPDARSGRRVAIVTLVLGFLATGIHGYLAVMAAALVGASLLRLCFIAKPFSWPERLAWFFAGPVVTLFGLWLFGYLSSLGGGKPTNMTAEGFGQFSADLLTFFNPTDWSRLVPPLGMGPRQYEGYAYLGIGTASLLLLGLASLTWKRPSRAAWLTVLPSLLACLALFVFALSNHVTIGGKGIADFVEFYARLEPLPSIFRSSGRFVFPLYALLTMTAVLAATRLQEKWRPMALGLAALLQLVDFDPTHARFYKPNVPAFTALTDPAWKLMHDGYRHIVVHPIQLQWLCAFDGPLIAKLSWEAYLQGLTINSGHVGRPPPDYSCTRHLAPEELQRDAVYLPYFKQYLPDFTAAGFICGAIENRVVCVSPDNDTPLKAELLRRRGP